MGFTDKVKNAVDETAGKAKQATGKATDDQSLQAEGQGDQAEANVKKTGEDLKDAFKK